MFGTNSCAKRGDEMKMKPALSKAIKKTNALGFFITLFITFIVCNCLITSARSHEMWLEPEKFQLNTNDVLEVNIKLGEKLQGINLPFIPSYFEEFYWSQDGKKVSVDSRLGDSPAFSESISTDGLTSIIYVSKSTNLTYTDFKKFEKFAEHKDLGPVRQLHQGYGFSLNKFSETYRRFVKAIVGVGSAQGNDRYFGLTTEFILLNNPYEDNSKNVIELKLVYDEKPRQNAQVEVFERSPSGMVKIFTVKTSRNGIAAIPIKRGYEYLFDAVKLRKAEQSPSQVAVWETLWAALMVKIP